MVWHDLNKQTKQVGLQIGLGSCSMHKWMKSNVWHMKNVKQVSVKLEKNIVKFFINISGQRISWNFTSLLIPHPCLNSTCFWSKLHTCQVYVCISNGQAILLTRFCWPSGTNTYKHLSNYSQPLRTDKCEICRMDVDHTTRLVSRTTLFFVCCHTEIDMLI